MDNGPGIPEGQRERVFDRFYRVDGDRHNSQTPGCGLGLSIVKQVVDLHGACIQLTQSRFERGLFVMVTFAAYVPSAQDMRNRQASQYVRDKSPLEDEASTHE